MGFPFDRSENKQQTRLEKLIKLTASDMDCVNELILARANSHVELIPELARHLINSGGKRIRPMLSLASARLCGYQADHHIKLAASVEFMHTATLLHDDVVDESDLRRGKQAARLIWGNQASVLVGDYLLGQAFKIMVETESLESLRILSHAAAVIAEGEVLQLLVSQDTSTTQDAYLQVVNAKTAALISAATEVGAAISARPRFEQTALKSYGRHLGVAFQLIDDVLDYSGNHAIMGKNIGDDFRERKITMPVLLAFARGTEQEQLFWKKTLEEGKQKQHDFDQARKLMEKHKAIADTIEHARYFGKAACDDLAVFPASPWKEALLETVDFCLERVG